MKIFISILILLTISFKAFAIQYNVDEFCDYIETTIEKNTFNNEILQKLSAIYENVCN
mgnify:FL=1